MKRVARRLALALAGRATPVHLATSSAEREAMYRFRYRVYVEELKREIGGVDHARRRVVDDEDEAPTAWHFYIGSPDALQAVMRVRRWAAGKMPDAMREALSTDLFGPAVDRYVTAENGRLMVDPARRGRLLVALLLIFGYEYMVDQQQAQLGFIYCRPGLVELYRRLGYRTYGGRLVNAPEGLEVPMWASPPTWRTCARSAHRPRTWAPSSSDEPAARLST